MAHTLRGLIPIAAVALGLWVGTTPATADPGGLPICLEDLSTCDANLGVCTTALNVSSANLTMCTTNLSACDGNLAACTATLNACDGNRGACTATLNACDGNLTMCTTTLNTCDGNLTMCTTTLNTCDGNLGVCTANLNACDGNLGTCSASLNACGANLGTCTTDLNTCQVALATAQQFPASGQTTCRDASGVVISCTGTGQDGDVQAGATLSYMDNGDGTITDNNTKLVWEKKSADGGINDVNALYSWSGAFAHIAVLNATTFAGHGDWRLPNVRELQSILNYARFNPSVSPEFYNGCVPGAPVLTGSCTAFARYWTSTTAARTPTAAWAVWFDDGLAAEYFKISLISVRAVRGGF